VARQNRLSILVFNIVLISTVASSLFGCVKKPPSIPGLTSTAGGSTGGGSGGTINTTPKNVLISWTASKALGAPAGGYKIYAKLNQVPTTANTTPVTIANVGGIHTTSTTVPLAPGQYFISVSAYTADGDSPLSSPYILTVP
jgi:hypothetical protein